MGFRRVLFRSVNTIVPGGMNTPITASVPPDVLKQQTSQIPMGKLGDPIEIANGALFLASDEAKYLTGVDLDWKSVVSGKSVSVRVKHGGPRTIKKKKTHKITRRKHNTNR